MDEVSVGSQMSYEMVCIRVGGEEVDVVAGPLREGKMCVLEAAAGMLKSLTRECGMLVEAFGCTCDGVPYRDVLRKRSDVVGDGWSTMALLLQS
jgi:hypothetical protein